MTRPMWIGDLGDLVVPSPPTLSPDASAVTHVALYPGASHVLILAGRPSHRIDYDRRSPTGSTSTPAARSTA